MTSRHAIRRVWEPRPAPIHIIVFFVVGLGVSAATMPHCQVALAEAIPADELPDKVADTAPMFSANCPDDDECTLSGRVFGFQEGQLWVLLTEPLRVHTARLDVSAESAVTTLDDATAQPLCTDSDEDEVCESKAWQFLSKLRKSGVGAVQSLPYGVSAYGVSDGNGGVALLGGRLAGWYLHLSNRNGTLRASLVTPSNQVSERLLRTNAAASAPELVDVGMVDDALVFAWRDGPAGPYRVASASLPPSAPAGAVDVEPLAYQDGVHGFSPDEQVAFFVRETSTHDGTALYTAQVVRLNSKTGQPTVIWSESGYELEDPLGFNTFDPGDIESLRLVLARHEIATSQSVDVEATFESLETPAVVESGSSSLQIVWRDDDTSRGYQIRATHEGELVATGTMYANGCGIYPNITVWSSRRWFILRGTHHMNEGDNTDYLFLPKE